MSPNSPGRIAPLLPILVKGALWFVLGVGALLGGIRLLAALVQVGLDGRWRAHVLVASSLAWATAVLATAGVVAIAVGCDRRRSLSGADVAVSPAELISSTRPPAHARRGRVRAAFAGGLGPACAPIVAILVTWPAVAHLRDRLIGATDAKYNAWLGWRMATAWRAGTWFPTRFDDALYPIGVSLWLIDGLLPTWVCGGWNLLTGNPLLAYNLAILTGVVANFLAAHHLAAALTDRRLVRVAGAAAFAAAPAITGALDAHITFVYAFTLPLLLREAIVSARGDRPLRPWNVALLLVIAFLCSAYHLIFGGILFLLVMLCWPRSHVRARRGILRLLIGLAVAAIVLSPFIVHRLDFTSRERAAGAPKAEVADAIDFSNDALDTVSRPADATVRLALPRVHTRPLFAELRPAFAGLLLLGGIALGWGATHPGRRPLLIAAGALWLLGLGPTLLWNGGAIVHTSSGDAATWLPYQLLLDTPGLGVLRAPYRTNYAFAAAACALLVIGLDAVAHRLRRLSGAAVTGLVVVALFVGSLSIPVDHSGYDYSLQTRRGLERIAERHDRSGSVIVVPFECGDDNRLSLWQTIHRHPLLGCSTVPAATPWYSGMQAWVDSPELASLRCDPSRMSIRRTPFKTTVTLSQAGLRRLHRELGVRYLIYERLGALSKRCESVRDLVSGLTKKATVLSDDGVTEILDLGPSPGGR